MKKVGILTVHRASNYGAVFQAYGLEQTLIKLGADASLVDYKCQWIENFYNPRYFNKRDPIKSIGKMILKGKENRIKKGLFQEFTSKYLIKSEKEYSLNEIIYANDDFDTFIAGSDQIWRGQITGNDTTFLLDFVLDNKKKNSYAASFGSDSLPEKYKKTYARMLKEFNNISVREKSGSDIIKDLIGKEASVNVDPVLLLSKEDWGKLAVCSPESEKYILIYTLAIPKNLIFEAQKIAKEKNNMKIIWICDRPAMKSKYHGIDFRSFVSPEEFITLYKNASYVMTNTFHGAVFSVIFEKQFITENSYEGWKNGRGENLLSLLSIPERDLSQGVSQVIDKPVDYKHVEEIIKYERQKSNEYLRGIISE